MLETTSPFSFVLFGASGHLAKLKIYPALYTLALKKRLPEDYVIMGYARSAMDDASFRKIVSESITEHMGSINQEVLDAFLSHVHYHQGQYDSVEDFRSLKDRLSELEKSPESVRVAYLSIPPSVFGTVAHHLCESDIHDAGREFRIIVEKPVGHDLKSAEEIWSKLLGCFQEDEIYLLDHYLGKEAVRNVYYLRYANPIVERLLKNTLIKHIEIVANEKAGLEGRAGYFEGIGMFRDWVQSHLLQIASLLTMRLREDEDAFRESRLNALSQFYIPPSSSMDDIVLQGQYAAGDSKPDYTEEEGVEKDSRTNTFIALKLQTRISRFDGVPIYFHTGKRLNAKETRINIAFQEPHAMGKGATHNRLDIILLGEAGMKMYLQTKLGGSEPAFRPLVMEDPLVCVGDCLPEHGLLILEAVHGHKQWFLTMDEVRTAWRICDPIQAHLDKPETPLYSYETGTLQPKEAADWMKRNGNAWLVE